MSKASEYQALHDQLRASRGVKLRSDLLSRQITFYTFQHNHAELDQLIRLHYQLQVKGKLGDFADRQPLHDLLFEVTRRLQNFVFAAKALIEHTRNYMTLWHRDHSNIMEAYNAKINEHFGKSGIAAFTKCLRDYFAHCTTPFISSLDEPDAHLRFTLQLETKAMENTPDFRGWTHGALLYIAEHRDTYQRSDGAVNLGFYINDYYEAVIRFYSWLDEQNQEWCRDAWNETLVLSDRIEAFWQSVRQAGKPSKT